MKSLWSRDLSKNEIANVLTHGFGLLVGLLATPYLIYNAFHQNWLQIAGILTFCISIIMVYGSSTIYHLACDPASKRKWRIVDHMCIYILIAGSHTPFIIYFLNNSTGQIFLVVMWTMAVFGIIFKYFFTGRFDNLSLAMYIGMGWMSVFVMNPILENMNDSTFYWLLGGGVAYMLGTIFYKWERIYYHHAIWHLFVMAGSFAHFVAVCEATWSV